MSATRILSAVRVRRMDTVVQYLRHSLVIIVDKANLDALLGLSWVIKHLFYVVVVYMTCTPVYSIDSVKVSDL